MALFWIIGFLSFLFSFGAKMYADVYFVHRVTLIRDWLALQLMHNEGIAFSMHLGSWLQLPLIVCALGFVLYLALHAERTKLHQSGYGLIIGGAFGNIVDRLPDGAVTDFIHVQTFPVFNVADSCITVGVALLLLSFALNYGKAK